MSAVLKPQDEKGGFTNMNTLIQRALSLHQTYIEIIIHNNPFIFILNAMYLQHNIYLMHLLFCSSTEPGDTFNLSVCI